MRHHNLPVWGLITVALAIAACQAPSPTEPVLPGPTTLQPAAASFSRLQGLVLAPANIVSAGSANVIAAGGGNFRTLAVGDTPVVGAEVFLADATGQPVPGYAGTTTNAQGHYSFAQVPTGFTFSVVVRVTDAEGRAGTLRTLVTTAGSGDNQANITLATTLAAALLTEGRDGSLGAFDASKFAALVNHLDAKLAPPPRIDLSNPQAVLDGALALVAGDQATQALVAELKAAIAVVTAPLTTLPTPTPTTAPTATPTSDAASPAPEPTTPPTSHVVDGVSNSFLPPTMALGATSYAGVDAPLTISMRHEQAAQNLVAVDTIQVRVTSLSEPDGELVTLTETGVATRQFEGSVPFERLYNNLGTLATIAGTGKIAVNAEGNIASEVVTVTYLTLTQSATYEEPTSTLTGIVTVGATPRDKAHVKVFNAAGTIVAETASRPDGTYAFHDLAPGTYNVVIAVNGAVTKTVSATIPSTTP